MVVKLVEMVGVAPVILMCSRDHSNVALLSRGSSMHGSKCSVPSGQSGIAERESTPLGMTRPWIDVNLDHVDI